MLIDPPKYMYLCAIDCSLILVTEIFIYNWLSMPGFQHNLENFSSRNYKFYPVACIMYW